MKASVITFILMSLAYQVNANELEIESVQMACIDKKNNVGNSAFNYRYGVELLVKNNSKQKIILVTKVNSLVKLNDGTKDLITLSYDVATRGDSVLIPPTDNLKLVELLPDDKTLISHQFSDENLLGVVSFELYSKELYGGRFKNWQGRMDSVDVRPKILYKCITK